LQMSSFSEKKLLFKGDRVRSSWEKNSGAISRKKRKLRGRGFGRMRGEKMGGGKPTQKDSSVRRDKGFGGQKTERGGLAAQTGNAQKRVWRIIVNRREKRRSTVQGPTQGDDRL